MYLIFIIPFLIYLKKDNKLFLFTEIFKSRIFFFSILSFITYIFTYFISTGCVFFPVAISCFENLPWSYDIEQVKRMALHYEDWAKAGSGAGYQNTDQANYVKYLNWLPNWVDKYFFNKVSDFLLGIIFLCLVMCISFIRRKNNSSLNNMNYIFYYLTIFILFLEWFFNHPALRYGGFSIIALLFFLPFSSLISKRSINNIATKVMIIVVISFVIFTLRNVSRLDKEINFYGYQILKKPYYFLDSGHFRIQKQLNQYIEDYENCELYQDDCNQYEGKQKIIYKFGKYIITRK